MIEKIKDFLYDISDIVLSLLIIAIIFLAVSWKISDTLDIDLTQSISKPTETETENIPVTVIIPDITQTNTDSQSTEEDENEDAESVEGTETENSSPATSVPSDSATSNATAPATATNNPATNAPIENFIVPSGATGYSIGKKLVEEGYISDVNTFVNRLVAMKLDGKLRAGTFKLSKSDDLDTIIKVLAGQSR